MRTRENTACIFQETSLDQGGGVLGTLPEAKAGKQKGQRTRDVSSWSFRSLCSSRPSPSSSNTVTKEYQRYFSLSLERDAQCNNLIAMHATLTFSLCFNMLLGPFVSPVLALARVLER